MTKPLVDAPNMEQMRKQAKALRKGHQAKDPYAVSRIREFHPEVVKLSADQILDRAFDLADAQLTIAREYGFPSWPRLKKHIDTLTEAGQLKAAITANDVAAVKQMVKRDPDLIAAPIGYGGDGALTWAAECRGPASPPSADRLEIARFLIEAGADVHEGGDGPLMRAALNDLRIPMMELLVANGANVNAKWRGWYPIIFAPGETMAPKVMKWLLDHGADPNIRCGSGPEHGTPLDYAIGTYDRAGNRQHACVDILVAAGARSRSDVVPSILIHRGRLDLLRQSLQDDPGLASRNFEELEYGGTGGRALTLRGGTLLHVAAEYVEAEAARLLIAHKADVNAKATYDSNGVGGQTPIFHAATQFRDVGVETVQVLIDFGADLTVRARVPSAYDRPGEILDATPLGYAATFSSSEWETAGTVDLLMRYGAPAGDVYPAAKLGLDDELERLLEAGGDPNAAHPYGETALQAAGRMGHRVAEQILLEAGAKETIR